METMRAIGFRLRVKNNRLTGEIMSVFHLNPELKYAWI